MPPLIAQVEFAGADVLRVVALIVALSQATYAFAPTVFGLIRELAAPWLFVATAVIQGLVVIAFISGRRGVVERFNVCA